MTDPTSVGTARSDYEKFLQRKQKESTAAGRVIAAADVNPMLHPWQKRIVCWAVKTGRAAVWADTGMGKTWIQLETARLAGSRALIVALVYLIRARTTTPGDTDA